MSDGNILSDDDSQEDGALDEQNQEQALGQGYYDETLEERLQSLVAQHAHERAELAEQISQLQEKNELLRQRVQASERGDEAQQSDMNVIQEYDRHPICDLALDFSLPEGSHG